MTYQAKYKENKRLLEGYIEYLEHCASYDQKLKLSTEIGRLNEQNLQIEKMSFADIKNEVLDYTLTINALFEYEISH